MSVVVFRPDLPGVLKAYGKKSCYFGFHSEVKFLMSFELIYFATFSCNFFGCLCSKVSDLFNCEWGIHIQHLPQNRLMDVYDTK